MTSPDPVERLQPGMRVVVRRRIEHGVTDALGDLVAMDAHTVSIQARAGLVVIDRATVVAAKEVPPRATRRGAAHLAISIHDLERIMVDGWPPVECTALGGWLLRAAGGFTGRANSVLPLGDPGLPMTAAVDHCQSWYGQRGQRPLFALFGPTGCAIKDDSLGRELLDRGYEPFNETIVMTAATRSLPTEPANPSAARVLLEATPSPRWWDAWAAQTGRLELTGAERAAAAAVMSGSPDQLFASLDLDGAVIGVARVSFAQGWAGVFALQVAPGRRRTGLATLLMGALAGASRERGIPSMYLQVLKAGAPARGLYEGLGFTDHHEYRYLGG